MGNSPCPSQESSPRSTGSAPSAASNAFVASGQAERRRIQQCVESIPPARQGIAQNIMAVEKMLRGIDRDLRMQCKELFGHEQLQLPGLGSDPQSSASAMEMEAWSLVPLSEKLQFQSLLGLRSAQQQLGTALAEFLRLPQKLKTVFDLTKTLSSEISGLVP